MRAGAALRAEDADAGMRAALALLADDEARTRLCAAGRAFATTHQGATARSISILENLHQAQTNGG